MSTSSDTTTNPRERIYTVGGMTCEHCVLSVREEVSELEGISLVEVDLARGRLRVAGPAADSRDAIRAAVEAAGYTVVES